MTLSDQINQDIKIAMLAKESKKLEALRAIKSGLLLLKTGKGSTGEISKDQEMALLKKLVKQRKESAAIYRKKTGSIWQKKNRCIQGLEARPKRFARNMMEPCFFQSGSKRKVLL